jgi:hypothetical protein
VALVQKSAFRTRRNGLLNRHTGVIAAVRSIALAGRGKTTKDLFVAGGHSGAIGVAYMTPVVTAEGDDQ